MEPGSPGVEDRTAHCAALPFAEYSRDNRLGLERNDTGEYAPQEAGLGYPGYINLIGSLPAGTVRCGTSPEGLPIGVMVVGARTGVKTLSWPCWPISRACLVGGSNHLCRTNEVGPCHDTFPGDTTRVPANVWCDLFKPKSLRQVNASDVAGAEVELAEAYAMETLLSHPASAQVRCALRRTAAARACTGGPTAGAWRATPASSLPSGRAFPGARCPPHRHHPLLRGWRSQRLAPRGA